MLSKKLTFSLVFVLALALVAGPAFAQQSFVSTDLNTDGADTPGPLGEKGFVIFEMAGANTDPASNGILGSEVTQVPAAPAETFPNLRTFFANGGTIELLMKGNAGKYTKAGPRLVISEILWGISENDARDQWIEVYNNGTALAAADHVVLLFTTNQRVERDTVRFIAPSADGDDVAASATPTIVAADTDDTATTLYRVVDRVTTRPRGGGGIFTLPGTASGRITAQVAANVNPAIPTSALVSAYRKGWDGSTYRALNGRGKDDPAADDSAGPAALRDVGDGGNAGRWAATTAPFNIDHTMAITATPGALNASGGRGDVVNAPRPAAEPASLSATGVIINEVRNDTSEANLDWIELFNNTDPSAAGAVPTNINNWQLSLVKKYDEEIVLAKLPSYKLQPGEYLVVYNRDPGDTILAGGVNVGELGSHVEKGASHKYVVSSDLNLPNADGFLLILRTGTDKNKTHEKVKDIAGNHFVTHGLENQFINQRTNVWPLKYWKVPGDRDGNDFSGSNFASRNKSFGRETGLNDKGVYWPESGANRLHKDNWQTNGFGYQGGVGYDLGVDPPMAPGTPGYANNSSRNVIADDRDNAAGKTPYAFSGMITISEIMYDAGPRWNLIQWIELYNSSMTEAINLNGWMMEIRNEQTDVESFVDSSFEFKGDVFIQPNRTLLLVSGTGVNDVDRNRVYNLYENNRTDLGLVARDSRLLSSAGFYIALSAKVNEGGSTQMIVIDEAGNVMVDGAARIHQWDLPARGDVRQSLVRQYGSRQIDGTADMASDGTMSTSWNQSDLSGAGISFYGHRNDVGTPGFRLGGPLPVSLSSFRPVRDDATGHVVVRWITQSELNNAGFNILRSESKTGEFTVVNVKGIVPGHGTTSEKHVYEWTDTTAKPNVVYYYQIEDVSLDGKRTRLATTRLKGHVSAAGKVTTTWGDLKDVD
ncbi:MAG: lamin tail domain-containing protein [Candidatus Poribacteria bacterium]|nr:lamin tail domain-containing protein [Candidatus Poribacteria bacterium]